MYLPPIHILVNKKNCVNLIEHLDLNFFLSSFIRLTIISVFLFRSFTKKITSGQCYNNILNKLNKKN